MGSLLLGIMSGTAFIKDLANNGCGVGTLSDGRVIFLPFSIPGQTVRAEITGTKRGVLTGRVLEILSDSPDAISVDCPSYMECGGCCFRHLSYERECAAKEKFVLDAFTRVGLTNFQFLPILPSPRQEAYRNKAEFAIQSVDGRLTAGFFARGSHQVIPCKNCRIVPAVMPELSRKTCEILESFGCTAYDPVSGKGLLRHLVVRQSSLNGDLLLCIVVNGKKLPNEKRLCSQLKAEFPQLKTVILNENTRNTSEITGTNCRILWGDGFIRDELCGVPVKIGALSFFQVNSESTEQLYKIVHNLAKLTGTETLLDLYCGMGTIGLSMASQLKKLIGCEIIPEAVNSARSNAAEMGLRNTSFFQGDAGKCAARLLTLGLRPDIVVIDPPRRGCDRLTLDSILRLAPKKIISVSCDPATNARDLAYLARHGYTVQTLRPVDLFPRTAHVETVVLMSKSKIKMSNNI